MQSIGRDPYSPFIPLGGFDQDFRYSPSPLGVRKKKVLSRCSSTDSIYSNLSYNYSDSDFNRKKRNSSIGLDLDRCDSRESLCSELSYNESEYSYSSHENLDSPGSIKDISFVKVSFDYLNDVIITFKKFVLELNDKNYDIEVENFCNYLKVKMSKHMSNNVLDNEYILEFLCLFVKTSLILKKKQEDISKYKNEVYDRMLKDFGEILKSRFC